MLCYKYPGIRLFIGRDELKKIIQSTHVTLGKMFSLIGVPKNEWNFNAQRNEITFINGSSITYLDLALLPSDPFFERYGSVEFTAGWIEEAGEVDEMAFQVLKTRVGRHMNKEFGLLGKLYVTCNPKKNWLYRDVYTPWANGEELTEWDFVQSLFSDNPHTAESYGQQLASLTNNALKQRLMYGNWDYDDDPSRLVEYDGILDMFRSEQPPGDKYLTVDIARYGRDKTVIVEWVGWTAKKIHVFAQNSIDALQDFCRDVCERERIPRNCVIADEVGVGGGFVDNFKCKGFIGNASPIQLPQNKKNYGTLNDQCGFMFADKVNARQVSICSTEFENAIIEEVDQLRQKDMDKEGKLRLVPKDDVKKNIGRSPDFRDALMMRMYFDLQPTVNPKAIVNSMEAYLNRLGV